MPVELQIAQMTLEEKLRAMEALWADLSRHPDAVPSPVWHQDVLNERAERVRKGEEQYLDWETVKRALRDRLT